MENATTKNEGEKKLTGANTQSRYCWEIYAVTVQFLAGTDFFFHFCTFVSLLFASRCEAETTFQNPILSKAALEAKTNC